METSKILFTVHGPKNPAVVALQAMQAWQRDDPKLFTIDEESFRRSAEVCGDVEAEGFVVNGMEDVRRLCGLGKFTIVLDGDTMRAVLGER